MSILDKMNLNSKISPETKRKIEGVFDKTVSESLKISKKVAAGIKSAMDVASEKLEDWESEREEKMKEKQEEASEEGSDEDESCNCTECESCNCSTKSSELDDSHETQEIKKPKGFDFASLENSAAEIKEKACESAAEIKEKACEGAAEIREKARKVTGKFVNWLEQMVDSNSTMKDEDRLEVASDFFDFFDEFLEEVFGEVDVDEEQNSAEDSSETDSEKNSFDFSSSVEAKVDQAKKKATSAAVKACENICEVLEKFIDNQKQERMDVEETVTDAKPPEETVAKPMEESASSANDEIEDASKEKNCNECSAKVVYAVFLNAETEDWNKAIALAQNFENEGQNEVNVISPEGKLIYPKPNINERYCNGCSKLVFKKSTTVPVTSWKLLDDLALDAYCQRYNRPIKVGLKAADIRKIARLRECGGIVLLVS